MAVYPGNTVNFDDNTNSTPVNVSYMNARDVEIEAIETALGMNLVPNGSTHLVDYLKVLSDTTMVLAYTGTTFVGVGSLLNPEAKLHVAKAATGTVAEIVRISASAFPTEHWLSLGFEMNEKRGTIQVTNNTTSVGPLAINPVGGNVGIGTDAPGVKLDVRTDAAGSAAYALRLHNPSSLSTAGTAIGFNVGVLNTERARIENTVGVGSAGRLGFYTGTAGAVSEAVRIDENGWVGIGTTTPNMPLHVKGSDDGSAARYEGRVGTAAVNNAYVEVNLAGKGSGLVVVAQVDHGAGTQNGADIFAYGDNFQTNPTITYMAGTFHPTTSYIDTETVRFTSTTTNTSHSLRATIFRMD